MAVDCNRLLQYGPAYVATGRQIAELRQRERKRAYLQRLAQELGGIVTDIAAEEISCRHPLNGAPPRTGVVGGNVRTFTGARKARMRRDHPGTIGAEQRGIPRWKTGLRSIIGSSL